MNRLGVHRLNNDQLLRISELYGVPLVSRGKVEQGYRNASYSFTAADERELNFIVYKQEPGILELIRRTNELGRHMQTCGLPVRAPVVWVA